MPLFMRTPHARALPVIGARLAGTVWQALQLAVYSAARSGSAGVSARDSAGVRLELPAPQPARQRAARAGAMNWFKLCIPPML